MTTLRESWVTERQIDRNEIVKMARAAGFFYSSGGSEYMLCRIPNLERLTALIVAAKREWKGLVDTEPVAWMVYTLDGSSAFVTDNPKDFTENHRALPLYTAPPQRQPATNHYEHDLDMVIAPPQRKPLTNEEITVPSDCSDSHQPDAWRTEARNEYGLPVFFCASEVKQAGPGLVPLYTTPPQRQPLSNGEVWRLMRDHDPSVYEAFRLCERAHGIGGEE